MLDFYEGLIGEVKIYNRALTEQEIKSYYEETNIFKIETKEKISKKITDRWSPYAKN